MFKLKFLFSLLSITFLLHASNVYITNVITEPKNSYYEQRIYTIIENSVKTYGSTVVNYYNNSTTILNSKLIQLNNYHVLELELIQPGNNNRHVEIVINNFDIIESKIANSITQLLREPTQILNQQSEYDNDHVGNISSHKQTSLLNRKFSKNYNALGIGPAYLYNLNSENAAYMFNYAHVMEVTKKAAIKISFKNSIDFDNWILMHSISFGPNFYFTDTDFSPFIGADFGFAVGKTENDKFYKGFLLTPSLGITFFRTSTKQLSFNFETDILFDRTKYGFPGKVGIGIYLLF